jgi:hypothetical protein
MTPPIRITAAQAARTIEIVAQACPDRLPVIRALIAGRIGLVEVCRGSLSPRELGQPRPKPVLAIIGDDDHRSTGPAGFRAVKRFAHWARAAIVHAAAGEAEHYTEAVRTALTVRHALLIETDPAHVVEWRRLLGDGTRIPILEILPRNVHPVRPGRERLQ